MTQTELLTLLQTKYNIVGSPQPAEIIGGIDVKVYTVSVFKLTGASTARVNVGYTFVNQDQPTEAAYWNGHEPDTAPPRHPFLVEVETFIENKIADGSIEAAFITEYSINHEIAAFEAWRLVTNILKRFNGIMFRQSDGQIGFRLENT